MPQKTKEYVINYLGIEIKIQKLYVRTFDFSRVGKNCKLQFPKESPQRELFDPCPGEKKKKTNEVTFQQHDATVRKCPDEWVMADDEKKSFSSWINSIERPKIFFRGEGRRNTVTIFLY